MGLLTFHFSAVGPSCPRAPPETGECWPNTWPTVCARKVECRCSLMSAAGSRTGTPVQLQHGAYAATRRRMQDVAPTPVTAGPTVCGVHSVTASIQHRRSPRPENATPHELTPGQRPLIAPLAVAVTVNRQTHSSVSTGTEIKGGFHETAARSLRRAASRAWLTRRSRSARHNALCSTERNRRH